MSEAGDIITRKVPEWEPRRKEVDAKREALRQDVQERLRDTLSPVLSQLLPAIQQQGTKQITQALEAYDSDQEKKFLAIADGMYEYHEVWREEHNKLTRAHNETSAAMGTELEALKTRVAELEAERVQREEEACERAYFEVGDNHLFGSRLRWASRVIKYWWGTRVRSHA